MYRSIELISTVLNYGCIEVVYQTIELKYQTNDGTHGVPYQNDLKNTSKGFAAS